MDVNGLVESATKLNGVRGTEISLARINNLLCTRYGCASIPVSRAKYPCFCLYNSRRLSKYLTRSSTEDEPVDEQEDAPQLSTDKVDFKDSSDLMNGSSAVRMEKIQDSGLRKDSVKLVEGEELPLVSIENASFCVCGRVGMFCVSAFCLRRLTVRGIMFSYIV